MLIFSSRYDTGSRFCVQVDEGDGNFLSKRMIGDGDFSVQGDNMGC